MRDKYYEAVQTMCKRCENHDVCMGTGCEPKRLLSEIAVLHDNMNRSDMEQDAKESMYEEVLNNGED